MKKAFTLVEVMIVVAIIGILAAIVLPTFRGHIQEAKEAAAKDNLRILRNFIEVYAAQHNGVQPGYVGDNPSNAIWNSNSFRRILTVVNHYLSAIPANPFNNNPSVKLLSDQEQFPPAATGTYGWIYQPKTKTIKLDWPGKDKTNTLYYDY